jgi:hypothetical protein
MKNGPGVVVAYHSGGTGRRIQSLRTAWVCNETLSPKEEKNVESAGLRFGI